MRRKSLAGAVCPIARSLDVIGDWWSLLIVRDALRGMRRFSEFQKSLGVSKNILTQRLRTLVAQGILELAPATDGSAYREYVLTAKGRDLFHVLVALGQWGQEHLDPPAGSRLTMVDRARGEPLRRLELRARDGRVLGPGDTIMTKIA
ncbi:MAG: helix-turn-helix transcriptional regulator [Proteobacteria bacterium]|nr:helix-turn-helix transcriptional regulator [Pseudomonadota bacterium]